MFYIEFTNVMGPSAQNGQQFQGKKRCDILTAVLMEIGVYWTVMLCQLVKSYFLNALQSFTMSVPINTA